MSHINYLAVLCQDPGELAGFYKSYLGLRELGRNADGDVCLSDGTFKLSLFRLRDSLREPHLALGLHHLGISVDDVDAVIARYKQFNPRGIVVKESDDLLRGELRIYDPESNPITLSSRNFGLSGSSEVTPRIAHIALNAFDTHLIFDFYRAVFGFRELTVAHAARQKESGYRNRHVGDGFTNVAIQGFYNEEEGFEPRFGIAHIGFLVDDSRSLAESMRGIARIADRPATRKQSEIRIRDPEGNGCDLSQRGWEVDLDRWVGAGSPRAMVTPA